MSRNFMQFYVRCKICGHLNRPEKSILESALSVLTGKFNTCRGCGYKWEKIYVPHRPIVKKAIEIIKENLNLELGIGFYNRVAIKDYKKQVRRVPRAFGI